MFGCDKTITLVKHSKTANGDSYTAEVISGVGVTTGAKLQQDGKTVTAADICTAIIPQEMTRTVPEKDDYIILGAIATPPESLSALKTCGLPTFRVTAVNDYRGAILGHWEVIGA